MDTPKATKIDWYRSPVDRKLMAELNQRSDVQGLTQTLGHLGLLAMTGAASLYAYNRFHPAIFIFVLFMHGTFFAFLLNAFHELCHRTVFKTKSLNTFFLYVVSFLSWYHPVMFWASHQEHHKFTLHPPSDLEVVLPQQLTLVGFLKAAIVNPWDFVNRLKLFVRLSFGKLEGQWENWLFPETDTAARKRLVNYARFHIIGHLLVVAISIYLKLWMVPVVITLAPFYGGGLQWLCNNAQHTGLVDNVPDFRLCCRTIILNPFVSFLYWQMNYHTEHHMYAAVPCYNLPKLHALIKNDLPHCPVGLVETWQGIIEILKKQSTDPKYQYVATLSAKTPHNRIIF